MLFQSLSVYVKVIAYDPIKKLTIYSLSRDQPDSLNSEIKVIDLDSQDNEITYDVQGMDEAAPKLLGLSVIPYDFKAKEAYNNFNQELLKGILLGHKHKLNEAIVTVGQMGHNFKYNGLENPTLKRLQKGEKVIMVGSYESELPENNSKVWKCASDSYVDKGGMECVHLKGFSGAYFCKYLLSVK